MSHSDVPLAYTLTVVRWSGLAEAAMTEAGRCCLASLARAASQSRHCGRPTFGLLSTQSRLSHRTSAPGKPLERKDPARGAKF